MFWQEIQISLIATILFELLFFIIKKSVFVTAPYIRLCKELILLYRISSNSRFARWKASISIRQFVLFQRGRSRYVAISGKKISRIDDETRDLAFGLLNKSLSDRKPVILLGEPGSGKTTVLEALTYHLARRAFLYNLFLLFGLLLIAVILYCTAPVLSVLWMISFSLWEASVRGFIVVPLFLEGRSLENLSGSVKEWRNKTIQEHFGDAPFLGSHNRIALFVDGFNEVQDIIYERFIEGWRSLLKDQCLMRLIFTSRPGDEDPSLRLGLENVISICELDDRGVHDFLRVYNGPKFKSEELLEKKAKDDFVELRRKNLIGEKGIGRNPYWLKMIAESEFYTPNRGMLFYRFIEKLILREIAEKPEDRKRKPNWRIVPFRIEMEALASLALAMHREGYLGYSNAGGWRDGCAAIRASIKDSDFSPNDVLSQAEAATLITKQFNERIQFVHQLVQDFFAAYALRSREDWTEAASRCEDTGWWAALFFLGGLIDGIREPKELEQFVRQILDYGSKDHSVFVAIGLLSSVEKPSIELENMVIAALSAFTSETVTAVQVIAIRELVRILDDKAIDVFKRLFYDNNVNDKIKGAALLCATNDTRVLDILLARPFAGFDTQMARRILVSLGKSAVEILIAGLDHVDNFVREQSTSILGEISDIRAIEPLRKVLMNSDFRLSYFAADALSKIGLPAISSLVSALQDKNANARSRAAESIGSIAVSVRRTISESGSEIRTKKDAIKTLQLIHSLVTPELIAVLNDSQGVVRASAIRALGQIGDPFATEHLINILNGRDDHDSELAARSLIEIGENTVVQLERIAAASNSWVRLRAAEIMIQFGNLNAIHTLIELLQNSNRNIRTRAINAISDAKDERALQPLIALLHESDTYTRQAIIDALGEIGDQNASQSLRDAYGDSDGEVRWRAVRAIGKLRETRTHFELLVAALDDPEIEVRWHAAEALNKTGDIRAVEPLAKLLKDSNQWLRWRTASILGEFGTSAVEMFVSLMHDSDAEIRLLSARALGKIKDVRAIDALIPALDDEDIEVRKSVITALGYLKDSRATKYLGVILESMNAEIVECAIHSLGQIEDAEALAVLESYFRAEARTTNLSRLNLAAMAILMAKKIRLQLHLEYQLKAPPKYD